MKLNGKLAVYVAGIFGILGICGMASGGHFNFDASKLSFGWRPDEESANTESTDDAYADDSEDSDES